MNSFAKLNQLLNLSSREWPRVLVGWSMVFLSRIGFIMGGSILLAVFLTKLGIELLPLLFLGNAVLMMIGTMLYKRWIHKVKEELLMTFTVLAAAGFLLSSIFFLQENIVLFFILFLIAESVLLSQLNILISLFNEELFSPLESQRTFPIIESAETFGGIVGGLSLTLFANSLPAYKFILIWVVLLLIILPLVLRFNARTMEIPKLKGSNHLENKEKKTYSEFQKIPFLRGLSFVVLLFWAMLNILEFQYSKAIQEDVFSTPEQTLVLASDSYTEEQILNFEHQITQKLGTLHLIFNGAALLMQLILASRIITALGITSSMLLHPLLSLLNLIGMTLHFNFLTAALARGSYELTSVLFKTSYDSSYYAIPHSLRRDVKEFMQGLMKPLGALVGTLALFFIAFKLKGMDQTLALNAFLLIMAAIMAFILSRMGRAYTRMSEQNLSRKLDLPTRLNAIEILGQRGHESGSTSLQKILRRINEPEIVKEKTLNSLGLKEDPEAISTILEILKNKNDVLRLAAIEALSHYHNLRGHIMGQSFTRYRVLETLKEALQKEKREAILEQLVVVYYQIDPEGLIDLLMESLKKGLPMRPAFLRTLRLFRDPNLKYYLEDYLKSQDPGIRAAAVVALWQFKDMRGELRHHLSEMLNSQNPKNLEASMEACGRIKESSFREILRKNLSHASPKLRKTALLGLAQMEDESIIPELLKLLAESAQDLKTLPKRFRHTVEQALERHFIEKISQILAEHKHLSLEEMSEDTLKTLKTLYKKVNAHHEAHKIENLLDSKDSGSL